MTETNVIPSHFQGLFGLITDTAQEIKLPLNIFCMTKPQIHLKYPCYKNSSLRQSFLKVEQLLLQNLIAGVEKTTRNEQT